MDKPVLLFLAGGPGGTEMGAMRRHGQALEQDFVVATFDQRGAGKSYDNLAPTSTLMLGRAVRDTIEVTNYLRERFDQDKIYVVGNSWGSILGVLAAQQHPELYRAFVGTGQMVSPRETDRVFYEDTLAWARRTGDTGLVPKLTASGPPPYTNILDYEPALSHEHEVYPYDHSRNSEGAGGFSENLFVEEYGLLEQVHDLGAFLDVFTPVPATPEHRLVSPDRDVLAVAAAGSLATAGLVRRARAGACHAGSHREQITPSALTRAVGTSAGTAPPPERCARSRRGPRSRSARGSGRSARRRRRA